MKKVILFFFVFIIPAYLFSQTSLNHVRKTVEAVRIHQKPSIDGRLSEEIWQREGSSDFLQRNPIDGAEPTEKTMVWVAYDDKALYVAAFLYDSEPEKIADRLYRRDESRECDWFAFHIDPYYDRLSGYMFAINPAGSIADAYLSNDVNTDFTWDGVWDWAVRIQEKGWAVEVMVPFDQIRFPEKEEYIWGINFSRVIHRKNEEIVFSWRPKEESGSVSHFADLHGIKGIKPGRYIEFTPYTVGQSEFFPKEEGNPFKTGSDYLGNLGFDLKVGLKSNLTLDATINPDFGQVELDPAIINLTAYETFFQERRPFFIEGANIFNFGSGGLHGEMDFGWGSPDFFYSRRIGRAPVGSVSGDGFVQYPDRTTILGAAKITGKIGRGWNIGILNALTSREYAEIDSDGKRSKEEVEPRSNFGVLRIQKEFNEGRQGFGLIGSSVYRTLKEDALREELNKSAYIFGFDGWTFLDKTKTWVLSGWAGGTRVTGSEENILNMQKSSIHYFQRPDADYLTLDENATDMNGWGTRVTLGKQQGNIIFNTALGALSPGFNVNNMGFQREGVDKINGHIATGYIWHHPGKVFRSKLILFAKNRNYDFGGNLFNDGNFFLIHGQFLNYWGFDVLLAQFGETLDKTFTRGGPLSLALPFRLRRMEISSDSRKKIVLGASGEFLNFDSGSSMRSTDLSITVKPKSNISFSISPSYNRMHFVAQYITTIDDPLMTETYGKRYVYGEIDQNTLSTNIRLNWTFTPRLTLQGYIQPFIAVGDYYDFKEFAMPGTFDFNKYGDGLSTVKYEDGEYTVDPDGKRPAESFTFNDPDFNVKSLRGTVVLRWEYHPGSRLYAVWTQNRADYENPGDFDFRRDFNDMWGAKGTNVFLVKVAHRLKF